LIGDNCTIPEKGGFLFTRGAAKPCFEVLYALEDTQQVDETAFPFGFFDHSGDVVVLWRGGSR
jgi:hypothetical protein